ncbi:hypothetical protein PF011_g21622 [Phytophthora fragariae]|uniref:Uncharacterized protein n=1 Tax=Phytophthora fragariae TaxID=53985 RepID=A0A6A3IPF9_9STRA|nr:hypothetical protein PF011_g21622 [Phytophthora fragariae]
MLSIECLPLESPDEGWQASKMMWVRMFVSSVFVSGETVFLAKLLISEAPVSTARAIVIAIMSAVCYTGLEMLLAAVWEYPLPFGLVLMVCPFVTIIMSWFLICIGVHALKTNKKLQKQLIGHAISVSAQALLVVAYPTFIAVFLRLDSVEQAIFTLVLPVIRFTAKQVMACVSTHVQDFLGVSIVFSVDVFNVLYVAICMQTARSLLTTALVMTFDTLHNVLALRTIYYHTKSNKGFPHEQGNANCVERILSALEALKPPYSGEIRVFDPYKLPLSTQSETLLDAIDQKLSANRAAISLISMRNALVVPEPLELSLDHEHSATQRPPQRAGSHRTITARTSEEEDIEEGLQVLFHCEYVILTEYVECTLPIFYAAYLAGLYQLPTAAYYPFTRSMTSSKMTSTLVQLVIYSFFEFGSLAGLYTLLTQRLGYSPAYQLAFVLETHVVLIQSLLFIWIIFIAQLTLVQGASTTNRETREGLVHVLLGTYRELAVFWYRSQIGNRQLYSVERLLAFRDYHGRTSLARVVCVCVFYPIPAFLVVFLIDCIPLADPNDGWKANWALWIRMLVSSFVVSAGALFQFNAAIEVGAISNARTIGAAIAAAFCYTGASIALAATWKFPIPFGLVVMAAPYQLFINGAFVVGIELYALRENAKLRGQILAHFSVASAQLALVAVYPLFSAIFVHLSASQQALFVLVLPTLKFVLKQMIARVSTHLHERVGSLIVFTVDIFNVIYVSMCMQTAQSALTTFLLMASDVFHLLLALRTIYFHTNAIQEYREHASTMWKLRYPINYLEGMPAMLRSAFDEARTSQTLLSKTIRVFAPFKLSVSPESTIFLAELAAKSGEKSISAHVKYPKCGPALAMIPALVHDHHIVNTLVGGKTVSQAAVNPEGFQPLNSRAAVTRAHLLRKKSMSSKSISHASLLANLRRSSLVPLGAPSWDSKSTGEAATEGLQALFHCDGCVLPPYTRRIA